MNPSLSAEPLIAGESAQHGRRPAAQTRVIGVERQRETAKGRSTETDRPLREPASEAVGDRTRFDPGGHGAGDSRYARATRVTQALAPVLTACDLIVGTEEEMHIAAGIEDTLAAIRQLRARTAAVG